MRGDIVSNHEKYHSLICFMKEQLSSIMTSLSLAKGLAEGSADDAYCTRLYTEYQTNPDKGETVEIETIATELGISL